MDKEDTRYYILFANYEQGLALHELLSENDIRNRIAPTPRSIQGKLSCGMSLLLESDAVEAAKKCMEENRSEYYDIVPLKGQIHSHRDRYC